MVKLVQAKYIKQLFIFLVFTFLLSYQQNAKAESGSLNAAFQIMMNNGVPTNEIYANVGPEVDGIKKWNIDVLGLLSFAIAGEDNYLMDNYTESERAFISVLESDTDTYEAKRSAAATVMAVDALSLLVSLVDELIVLGATTDMESRRAVVANDVHGNNNPIVVQAAGLGQISAYSELFEWYRSFLRGNLNTTYVRIGRANRDPLREMRRAFTSNSDYLSGRALLQTPECSSLFCSLYTLRREYPDISINEFTFTQILRNERYEAFSGDNPGRDSREGVQDYILGDEINRHLNSLRQSRAATETVLPGNDPNPYQAPEAPEISDECRMAPSLPGC